LFGLKFFIFLIIIARQANCCPVASFDKALQIATRLGGVQDTFLARINLLMLHATARVFFGLRNVVDVMVILTHVKLFSIIV